MVNNELADKIIAMALAEKRSMNQPARAFRCGHGEKLGYFVYTVFDAATGLEHSLPFKSEIERCDDQAALRHYILQNAI